MDGAAEDGVHCTPYSSAVAVATSLGWRVELEPDVLAELSARWALSGHRGAEHLDAVLSALAAPPSEMTCRYDPSAFAGGVSEATKSLEMEMANVEEDVTGSGAAGAVAHAMTTSCAKDNDVSDCTSASTLAAEEIALPDERRWSATPHAVLEDVLTVPCAAVPRHGLVPESKQVLVSHLCAMAVLRGADVFSPGVLAVSSDVQQGDAVSIWADMDGACVRGTIAETFIRRKVGAHTKIMLYTRCMFLIEFQFHTAASYFLCLNVHSSTPAPKVFVGNAVATLSRIAFFRQEAPSGVYAKVTDPLFPAPRFSGSVMFALQNVPSCAVAHELDVEPGHAVIDMCAAPGGKTAHVATLMRGRGKLVALDRSARRAEDLAQVLASRFPWVDVRKMDATKCLGGEQGFPAATFDRVLLDAPCTGLGQV